MHHRLGARSPVPKATYGDARILKNSRTHREYDDIDAETI
jgi:hypothetical protein